MSSLSEVISDVRGRIGRYRGSRSINEQNTKATLVEPVLRALGWNLEDLEEVQREYRRKKSNKPVDYAFLINREPKLFVEAKALGQNLGDSKWANQIMGYATVAGVKWVVLTDGDEYRIYNSHAPVPVDEKLFRKIRLSEDGDEIIPTLTLLSRDQLGDSEIDKHWNAFFVDRQVLAALEDLFAEAPDKGLVNVVKKRTSLSYGEVKASLTRARIDVEFPLEVAPPTAVRKKRKKVDDRGKRPRKGPDLLAAMIEAGTIKPPFTVERTYKGKPLTARVESDGTVSCAGGSYRSLSVAASAALETVIGNRRPANGWVFWRYRDADGNWHKVDDLRKEYFASHNLPDARRGWSAPNSGGES